MMDYHRVLGSISIICNMKARETRELARVSCLEDDVRFSYRGGVWRALTWRVVGGGEV
jgi:hypothetical protein